MSELATVDSGPAVSPMQMLQIAVEQNADIDKLQKLMDLHERWEANQAKKSFVDDMARFREKCPTIAKDKQGHNGSYAGLASSIEAVKELMSECNLSHSWKQEQNDGFITVTCCLTHSQGHSECTSLTAAPDPSGGKNAIQAIGSTVSYLERYTFFSILGLASDDMDDDANHGAPIVSEEYKLVLALMAQNDALGLYLLTQAISEDALIDIHGGFPEGHKSSLKERYRELESAGIDTLDAIADALDSNDAGSWAELREGMSAYTKRLLNAVLNEHQQSAAKELAKVA